MVSFLKNIFKDPNSRFLKNNRKLAERSHLTLEFPQSNDRVIRTFIPFMENPIISEKGRANLNSYNLVGRAGQLFSYAGADSRKLTVSFNITLLHVIEMASDEGIDPMFTRQFKFFFTEREASKRMFELKSTLTKLQEISNQEGFETENSIEEINKSLSEWGSGEADTPIEDKEGFGRDYASNHRNYYKKIAGLLTNQEPFDAEAIVDSLLPFTVKDEKEDPSKLKNLNDSIDLVYLWLNLIRGTVLNRSDNTAYGPPIVRLTHGAMYSNVPCLVEDYSVQIEEEAGYDVQTLTPKRIRITLNMVESRAGNFGNYDGGRVVTGDNLTGWESIISNNELDPCNGIVAQSGDLDAI